MFALSYTGIIVDARHVKLEPALFPRIFSQEGEEIYGLSGVTRTYVVQQGMALYVKDVEVARKSIKVGNNPLEIEAVGEKNGCDLVVGSQDAAALKRLAKYQSVFLKCSIVILIQ